MEADLAEMLRDVLASNARNEQIVAELASVIETLLTILAKKGELDEGHLRVIGKLRKHAKLIAAPAIALATATDKYTAENSPVDCENRMHLCQGRCCSFEVRLSKQDLEEGKLEWKIEQPYYLPRDQTGFCIYQHKETGQCGQYEVRPAACRTYDCREDSRVWLDYEKMIPAPMPSTLVSIKKRPL